MVGHSVPAPDRGHKRAPISQIAAGSERVSTQEAAAILGVNERTIRRAIARGELAAIKQGRSFQITPAALAHYHANAPPRVRRRALVTATAIDEPTRPVLVALPWTVSTRLTSLPAPLTSFVGREREVAAVADLIRRDDVRLVTLTGPGGVGKTRLALRVAKEIGEAFVAGVAFVDLAPARNPADVLAAVAAAIGVPDLGKRPLRDSLVSVLAERDVLLILDNFEHVLSAAPLIAGLLARCPRVRILASSRAPLGVAGEHLWPVAPLPLPPVDHAGPDFGPAVALFVERAQAVVPEFQLSAANAATVMQICRRLEGLPLALELAAARMRLLSPAELLARLTQRLPLLSGGTCDLPPRLRTLESAIAWSYDLLTPAQRRLCQRLAVFVGGFTIEAVEAVAAADVPDLLEALQGLVDQSLVMRGETPPSGRGGLGGRLPLWERGAPPSGGGGVGGEAEAGESRFTMLETIREYVAHRLREGSEDDAVRDAHAAWCIALAEHADVELRGAQQAYWYNRLREEHANMRAALTWLREREEAERGLRLARALSRFWGARGYYTEARAWFDALLALPAAIGPRTRARVAMELSSMARWQGDGERAAAFAAQALALFQDLDDPVGVGCALRCLASNALDQRAGDTAASFLARSDALLASRGTPWDRAFSLYLAGRLGDVTGDDKTAMARFAAAAEAFRAIGDRDFVAAALARLAATSWRLGDHAAASTAYAESLRIAAETNEWSWVAWALAGAARLALGKARPRRAARFLGAASALRDAIGERHTWDADLETKVRAALPENRFGEAWQEGLTLPLSVAIDEAFAGFAFSMERSPRTSPASPRPSSLTTRERDVLRLLTKGLSDKEIAATLGIARHTASNHVTAIRDKLGVPSRAAAAALAVQEGLI